MQLKVATTTTLLLLLFFLATATPPSPQPSPTPTNCSDELVSFSMCLPYISSSPNNISDWPSHQCCNDVASTFISGTAVCLCYLVRKPLILGFPLNSTRLYSLTSLCPMIDRGTNANLSLLSLCSGSHNLPPLQSITGPGKTKQNASNNLGSDNAPPPPSGLKPEENASDATDTADDYETEPSMADDFDQQERPVAEPDGISPRGSFAWEGNNRKWGLLVFQLMMLVAWVSM